MNMGAGGQELLSVSLIDTSSHVSQVSTRVGACLVNKPQIDHCITTFCTGSKWLHIPNWFPRRHWPQVVGFHEHICSEVELPGLVRNKVCLKRNFSLHGMSLTRGRRICVPTNRNFASGVNGKKWKKSLNYEKLLLSSALRLPVEVRRRFRGKYSLQIDRNSLPASCLTCYSALKMEAVCSVETSVNIYLNIRHQFSEDKLYFSWSPLWELRNLTSS
jgi:hypothetical protein